VSPFRIAAQLLAVFAISASGRAQAAEAGQAFELKEQPRHFIVTTLDPRLCPSPFCGGYFVKDVNKPRTRCADGSWQRQCHAATLDTSATGWSEKDLTLFVAAFGQRQAIARGTLRQLASGAVTVETLVIDEGWLGQAHSQPRGGFYGLRDSGIVCVTTPCPSIHQKLLNFRGDRLIAGIDLRPSGATREAIVAGYKALTGPAGILAAGQHEAVVGPAGRGIKLAASEFYLLLVAEKSSDEGTCGGPSLPGCARGQFCDIGRCGEEPPGVCRTPPRACILLYDPVCGCDGITYGNDCERQAAQVPLDHVGECRKP
jgi:hypothetical protein